MPGLFTTTAIKGLRARLDPLIARARDAVRTFRGKPPKYSALAKQCYWRPQDSREKSTRSLVGIRTTADVAVGAISDDERRFLEKLVRSVCECDGPIVQFGSLLGEASFIIGRNKAASQLLIAADPGHINPWGMAPSAHRALLDRILEPLVDARHVECRNESLVEFFHTQADCQPALVFLNHVPDVADAEQIIAWATASGARVIAGRAYDYANPAMMKLIDEKGGPIAVEGGFWQLNLRSLPVPSARASVAESTSFGLDDSPDDPTNPAGGLVSIIMPAYNAREFVETTLRDIETQLYSNWELIVIEDGSAEDIQHVIHRFASKHVDHRVVYHRMPQNVGVSRARNEAMKDCRGDFIAFLDADDRWSRDHLQRKVRLLHRTSCDVAYSRVEMFDSDSGQPLCTWGPSEEDLQKFPESMFRTPYLQPSSVVVRRSFPATIGGFDETLAYAEDYDYWFRAVHAGKTFCFDEKVTSRYRKNHASAATTDRLVLCFDGVADVTRRHMDLLAGKDTHRERVVANHYLAAGAGHLAYPPSQRNRCCPDRGVQLLRHAREIGEKRWEKLAYYLLAKAAATTRTTPLARPIFRQRFRRYLREL